MAKKQEALSSLAGSGALSREQRGRLKSAIEKINERANYSLYSVNSLSTVHKHGELFITEIYQESDDMKKSVSILLGDNSDPEKLKFKAQLEKAVEELEDFIDRELK